MELKHILNGNQESGCFLPHEPLDVSADKMPWE